MLHESLITPKSKLTTVTENTTIAQVNDLFNSPSESHTRTMPILDESGNLFVATFISNMFTNISLKMVI